MIAYLGFTMVVFASCLVVYIFLAMIKRTKADFKKAISDPMLSLIEKPTRTKFGWQHPLASFKKAHPDFFQTSQTILLTLLLFVAMVLGTSGVQVTLAHLPQAPVLNWILSHTGIV